MLPIQDINAIADLIVIISCIVLVHVWSRKKCYHFAAAFVPIIIVFIVSFLFNKFRVTGELDLMVRAITSVIFVVSIAIVSTQIMKECKKLYITFSLYIIFLISLFFTPNIDSALVFSRIIGLTIVMPFLIMLFAYKHIEIKIVSFIVIIGVVGGLLLSFMIFLHPSLQSTLPFFISKICYAAAFILLAHFSVHKPNCILDAKIIRTKKRVKR